MARQRKPPSEEKQQHLKRILGEIETRKARAEKAGDSFTAPTEEQLRAKLGRANSPMIVYQSWSGSAPAGGTITYEVGITNPDPTDWFWLFVHLFVGPGNMVPDTGEALEPVDERFPRLTEPSFDGLRIAAGATEHLDFTIRVPAGVEKSNYLGNSFLFYSVWHDPGVYIDRSIFVFGVT
jgi:hypothetical protein